MEHNLIPPFLMREAGIEVNDTPKIHSENPQVEDHSVYFPLQEVRITLDLIGIFSYFATSKPSENDLDECERVMTLTPDGNWDPHTDVYSRNEINMLDNEGNMIEAVSYTHLTLPTICSV